MKRIAILATAALLAMFVLVPTAMAQGNSTMMKGGGTTMMKGGGTTMMKGGETTMMKGGTTMMGKNLPSSGGPAILLPAAALLLGSGVLAFAVLRRR